MSFRHHEERKRMLSQERKNEYNEYLEKQVNISHGMVMLVDWVSL